MNATRLDASLGLDADLQASIERRLGELDESLLKAGSEPMLLGYLDLHSDLQRGVAVVKRRLLGTSLEWTDCELAGCAWIHHVHDAMARIGRRTADQLARGVGAADKRTVGASALALFYMGEVLKCEVVVGRHKSPDYRGMHQIMSLALSSRRHRDALRIDREGALFNCTIEGLYFRALLLARFAGGTLSPKQIEILDACMWIWMPIYRSVRKAPPGAALRADLDSSEGLRRGPRSGSGGVSLYLPQGPIVASYRAMIRGFHQGRILASVGCCSTFRIEEHIAVLKLVRMGLRESLRTPVVRARRQRGGFDVEVLVGLAEVMERGYQEAAPSSAVLSIRDTHARASQRERDNPLDTVYDRARRPMRLLDVSETGLGLEGTTAQCGEVAVGDLLGVQRGPGAPMMLAKVVRRLPIEGTDRWVLGARRLGRTARPLHVARPSDAGRGSALLYVPGADESGRHDACLMHERDYRDARPVEAEVGGNVYSLRFNRQRDHGNGWMLAGFEIAAARKLGTG